MLDTMYIPYASRKVGGWHVGICRRFKLRLKLQLMKGPLITLRMKGLMIPPFQRRGPMILQLQCSWHVCRLDESPWGPG